MLNAMENTTFTNLFAPFDRANSAACFRALRQAARTRLAGLPWPSTRSEDWRFTNVSALVQTPFELPQVGQTVDLGMLPAPSTPDGIRIVFINGRYAHAFSRTTAIPDGVDIGSLSDANSELLARLGRDDDSVFTTLNTSFLGDGVYIVVPAGKIIEQPIEVLYVSQAAGKPTITNPRTLLILGKNAQATIVERYLGTGAYFTNAVTEIALAEHAVCDHVKVQQESMAAFHIASTHIVQSARSNFTTHYLSLGGSLVRNEVRVRFDGEHAEATVNGLYLAHGKQHMDNFTVIDHAQPNCASHEVYKGILDEHAHGVFNGKIFVRKDAQKTDAKQTNKVLLLSDDATINTKPQLEIFADDVKCTHGATIGQLDANQLFYLQSRGIPLDAARRLLTFAFANDVVGRLKIEALRTELEARIVK